MGTTSPFYGSSFVSQGGLDYLIGALLIVLGILFFMYIRKAQRRRDEYKEKQLETYNKNHPLKKPETNYKRAGLYVPMLTQARANAPLILGLCCFIVAITFFVGTPIQTL